MIEIGANGELVIYPVANSDKQAEQITRTLLFLWRCHDV
jgi:hypothetical protein